MRPSHVVPSGAPSAEIVPSEQHLQSTYSERWASYEISLQVLSSHEDDDDSTTTTTFVRDLFKK